MYNPVTAIIQDYTHFVTLHFGNGQTIPNVPVKLLDVDEEGTAYSQLPSGLTHVCKAEELSEAAK